MNRGRRFHVIPGARMRWMVTTKFSPVKMDENPTMKMASPASALSGPPWCSCTSSVRLAGELSENLSHTLEFTAAARADVIALVEDELSCTTNDAYLG